MCNVNDNNYFHRNSGNSNGLPKIGMEDNDYLLFSTFSLMGDNDNECHQNEFIHVNLVNDFKELVIRLTVFRIIRTPKYESTHVFNKYDFRVDIDYDIDGPSGIKDKLICLLTKIYNKTQNRVKEEDISFVIDTLIAYLTKFKLTNNKVVNDVKEEKRYLTKEEVERIIDEKLKVLNKIKESD